MMNEFDELIQSPVSRRAFLQRMTAAGLGTAAAAFLAGCGGGGSSFPGNSGGLSGTGTSGGTNGGGTGTNGGTSQTFFDNTNFPGIVGRSANEVVLNFALTLEILEADLYRQALNVAAGLDPATPLNTSNLPTATTTGSYTQRVGNGAITNGTLATVGFLYLAQYAYVEAAHRDFLFTVLNSFGAPTATRNANGYTFPGIVPGADLGTILNFIYGVEETGVRAYEGAATFMTDNNLLTTAVAIHSTEARHSAGVAYILGKDTGPVFGINPNDLRVTDNTNQPNPAPYHNNTFEYHLTPPTVLNAVKPFFK